VKTKLSLLAVAIQLSHLPIVHAEDDLNIDIAADLETIVVVGNKTGQKLTDVAGSISVLTTEDIERNISTNMGDLFKYDPSVVVTGKQGKAQNIVVRGMGSDRILMIKDGMRMNEGYGANGENDIVGRGFIDTSTLKQVEVAKGAASSLYGSDALGGIVVFSTKNASDYLDEGKNFAGDVSTTYAEKGQQTGLVTTFALRTGSFEHLLNLSYRDGQSPQNYDENLKVLTLNSKSLLYKLDYHLTNSAKLSLSADLWRQNSHGDSADGLLSHFRGLAKYGYKTVAESISGEQETSAYKLAYSNDNGAWYDSLNAFVYYNNSEQFSEEFGQLDINAPMFGVIELRDMWQRALYKQTTKGFISHANKKITLTNIDHNLGFGFDVENTTSLRTSKEFRTADGVVTRDTSIAKFPENDTLRSGVYINDQISLLAGDFTLTPSARWDYYDMDPNGALKTDGSKFNAISADKISLNLAALYALTPMLNVYAQYGQGFKVPPYDLAYIEHLNAFPGYTYHLIPSDELKPEQSDSYEIGLRGQLGELAFSSAIFYNKFDNFITTKLVNSEMIRDDDGNVSGIKETFQYQNIEKVTIKGVEIGLTYYIGDIYSLYANAAYQDGKDDISGDYINSINPLSGSAGFAIDKNNYALDITLNWAGKMNKVNGDELKTAGFVSIDVLAQYQASENIKLNMVINNLLDKKYLRHQNSQGHAQRDDLSLKTELGRNISISASYRF